MSAKGKSSNRAEPGSVNVDGDIESDASGCESVTVLNTKILGSRRNIKFWVRCKFDSIYEYTKIK